MTRSPLDSPQPSFDVIVIGAGHAGCEAALAAARVGASVLVLTTNLDRIGFMPCNPSIGGPAKGHIVAEVDALGGEMARAIDRTAIQIRMLNTSKGPAVRALRAQADKNLYSLAMKEALELQPGVEIRQESAREVQIEGSPSARHVNAVSTDVGNRYLCRAAVITAGTFLRGNMVAGEWRADGGRAGERSSKSLAATIGDVGIRLRRLKTGTPPRVDARSIDFDKTERQSGSIDPLHFSLDSRLGKLDRLELPPLSLYPGQEAGWRPQMPCYLVHTNRIGHQLIVDNVDRSPMYNGTIEGIGPRYCPSIEDKVMRFSDKHSHGLFLEPEGWRTTEMYVQGANTSLPYDVQLAFLRTIPALADVRITRFGYAVEYDAVEPTELTPWFASKRVEGLFLAGQVNGTSGYEEAAGQGLVAGLNAARLAAGLDPVTLGREQAYIGVMADDLTTMDFVEPYRMLTSRAEHRLLLRSDNADVRLAPIAYELGLIPEARLTQVIQDQAAIASLVNELGDINLSMNQATNDLLARHQLPPLSRAMTARDYARRPDVRLDHLLPAIIALRQSRTHLEELSSLLIERAEIELKYESYVRKQYEQVDRVKKMEDASIPVSFDYSSIRGFRTEALEKLVAVRPTTVGQASRIAGVTPSDIAVLLVHLRRIRDGGIIRRDPRNREHVASE